MMEQRWIELMSPEFAGSTRSGARRPAARRAIVRSVAVPLLAAPLLLAVTPSESRAPDVRERGVEASSTPAAGGRSEARPEAVENQQLMLAELLRRADSVAVSGAGRVVYLSWRQGVSLSDPRSVSPTAGPVSSEFLRERRHPVVNQLRPHRGVDIAAPWGAPILTPRAGVVVHVGTEAGYGKVVVIDHDDGVETVYAHCSQILVRERQHVSRDEPIALVGDTGLTTGPHLHYEVRVHGRHVDPLRFSW